jgi:phospholipase/carboxylesterase
VERGSTDPPHHLFAPAGPRLRSETDGTHRSGPSPWRRGQGGPTTGSPLPAPHDGPPVVATHGPVHIGAPGDVAWPALSGELPHRAFLVARAREFAHLPPTCDGPFTWPCPSHRRPTSSPTGGRAAPWAGTRLSAGFVMLFGPRDEVEPDVVAGVVAAAHAHATGLVNPRGEADL